MTHVREISFSPEPEAVQWSGGELKVPLPDFIGLHAYSDLKFFGLHP